MGFVVGMAWPSRQQKHPTNRSVYNTVIPWNAQLLLEWEEDTIQSCWASIKGRKGATAVTRSLVGWKGRHRPVTAQHGDGLTSVLANNSQHWGGEKYVGLNNNYLAVQLPSTVTS